MCDDSSRMIASGTAESERRSAGAQQDLPAASPTRHRHVAVHLIGAVRISVDGVVVPCRGVRESALLARLAIDVGSTVTRDRLLDDVWTDSQPGTRNTLRVQMWRLRGLFEAAGAPDVIETRQNGYALVIDRAAVDVLATTDRINASAVIDANTNDGDLSDDDDAAASIPTIGGERLLEGLEDLDFARNAAVRFDRLVVSAHQQRARRLLTRNRLDDAIEVLTSLFEHDPMSSEPAALLMQGYRLAGRRRDALRVAHRHRAALAEVGLLLGEAVLDEERRCLEGSANRPSVDDRPLGQGRLCDDMAAVVDAIGGQQLTPGDRGTGGLVCLSGEAGVGKSFVLDWIADRAARNGIRVARAAGDRFDSAFPLAVLRRALADEGVLFDDVIDPSLAPDPPTAWQRAQAKERVLDRVATVLGEPFLLILDDLHWADETSLVVVRGLADLARTKPLAIIAAGRPVGEWRGLLADIATVSTSVEPLGLEDSQSLAASFVGADLDLAQQAAVASAHGLPLLIIELLRGLASESRLHPDSESFAIGGQRVPRTIRDVVQRRVVELSDDAVSACRAASTLGKNATIEAVASFLQRAPLEVAGDVDEAMSAGLLRSAGLRIEFRHDLVRQAFDDTSTDVAHAALHRSALDFWSARGAPLATIAAHAVLAGGRDHDEELASWLTRAADLSGSLEPDSALVFLDKALASTAGDVVGRYEIQRARVEALTAAGRPAEAMRLLESVIDMVPERRAEAVLRLAGLRILHNDLHAGLRDIATVIDAPDAEADVSPPVFARLVALSAMTSVILLDADTGRPMADRATQLGVRCGDAVARSIAAAARGRADAFELLPTALSSLQLAVELADADATRQAHAYQPLNLLALTALDYGQHAIADAAVSAGAALQEHLFAPWTKPLFDAVEMTLAYRRGDFDGAITIAEQMLERRSEVGAGSVDAWAHATIALVAVRREDLGAAAAAAHAAENGLRETPNSLGTGVVVATQAVISAASGRSDEAFESLHGAWTYYESAGVRRRLMTFAAPLVLLAIERGDPATAAHVVETTEQLARTSETDAHRALATRLRGLLDGDVAALRLAADLARQADHALDADDGEREVEALVAGRRHQVVA